MAECGDPDTQDSPGARLLDHVRDAVSEHIEWVDEPVTDPFDYGDAINEIADGAPDVYTHARWLEFVDLCAYEEDPSELGADCSDMTVAAGVALYMIAERLATALFIYASGVE
jgi:hypothetical protein